tara:strand:- start:29 stop:553 length:525 start_codon:yes stop_codon:yes gene_type:complete
MRLKIGDKAVDFNLPSTDGEKYSLDNFKDKLIAVIFTCNHCPYAQAYEDRIKKLQEEFKDDLQIIAINSNDSEGYPEDSFENMKIKHKESNFNFPYLRDKTQEVAKAYGAEVTPDVFLFDKNRKLVYRGRIDDNWEHSNDVIQQDLKKAISETLQDRKVMKEEERAIGCSIKWK